MDARTDNVGATDIDTRKLFLTVFKDEKASELFHGEYTLPEWRDQILAANADAKAKLFWLKGARFGGIKSTKHSYRTNLNVLSITAVVVEHDAGTISFDEAHAILTKAGVRALVYTSPSHATGNQRWRVILPLSCDAPKIRHDILVAMVNGLFGGALSSESFVLSQSYYFGSVKHNPEHRCEIIDGMFLDLANRLYAGSIFHDGSRVGDDSPMQRVRNAHNEADRIARLRNDLPDDPAKVAFALNQISSDIPYYPKHKGDVAWMTIGAALASEVDHDEGFKIFDAWSKTSARYDAAKIAERWKAFCAMSFIGIGTLYHFATEANPDWREEWKAQTQGNSQGPDLGSKASSGNAGAKPLISATPFILRSPDLIPQRKVIYGNHLIRKFGSATIAAGGVGKTKLIIAEALAMVTGRPLLGIRPEECSKVWVWNGEDPLEEIERSIAAACIHFRITPLEIEGGLFIDSGRDSEIVIAHQTRDGAKVAAPMVEALLRTIIDNEIDVVMIDPFISSHRVTENDNNSIDIVAKTWTKIADTTNTAIDLVHHSRKTGGAEVTVEDGRGAVALLNAVRAARSLNVMSEEEATKSGAVGHRRSYFKVEDGKANLFPPSEAAEWYHLQSVPLGNGPPNLPAGEGGDKIGVVTPWKWPDHLDGITGRDFEKVAAIIRAGKWRENSQASAWVGYAVAKALGLNITLKADKAKVIALLKVWLGAGSLIVVEGEDEGRNVRKFVRVKDDD